MTLAMMESVDKLRKRARAAYKSGEFSKAAEYHDAIERSSGHVASAEEEVERALALMRADRLADATSALKRAAQLDPANDAIWSRLGHLHIRRGRPRDALTHFKEAARLAPEVADHHWQIAVLEKGRGDETAAAAAIDATLAADPDHEEALAASRQTRDDDAAATGGQLSSGRDVSDDALASVARFVQARPVEDAARPKAHSRQGAQPLLTALAGALAFVVLYVWIRTLL